MPPPVVEADDSGASQGSGQENRASRIRRQSRDTSCVRICFVCQQRSNESLSYNDGGIGRCELDSSKKKLTDSKDKWLTDTDGKYIRQQLND